MNSKRAVSAAKYFVNVNCVVLKVVLDKLNGVALPVIINVGYSVVFSPPNICCLEATSYPNNSKHKLLCMHSGFQLASLCERHSACCLQPAYSVMTHDRAGSTGHCRAKLAVALFEKHLLLPRAYFDTQ